MNTGTYNGYANKETWGLALILDNDEWTHLETMRMAREALESADVPEWAKDEDPDQQEIYRLNVARSRLAERLEEWVDDMATDSLGGTIDLSGSGLLANAWTD